METNKDILQVQGIAIREGVSRNRIKYISEELKKFSKTMIGRPILKDHKSETDNVIGKITESSFSNDSVPFGGWIKEDGTGIIEKIKDERISEVSIGARAGKLVKESEESDVMIAKDMVAMELSTTPTPGVVGTSISQALESYTKNGKFIKPVLESFLESKREEIVEYFDEKQALALAESFVKEEAKSEDVCNTIETKEDVNMEEKKLQEQVDALKAQLSEKEQALIEKTEALKEQLEAKDAELKRVAEEKLNEAKKKYTSLCEKLSIEAKEVDNIDVLESLISSLSQVKVVEEKTEKIVETKKKAKVVNSNVNVDQFKGYVTELNENEMYDFWCEPSVTGQLGGGI